jgi:type IV pilus assembly protein PilB
MAKKTLIDLIIEEKLIDPITLDALKKKAKEKKIPLEDFILEKGAVKEEDFYRLKAKLLKFSLRSLAGKSINLDIFKLVPFEATQHYKFIPMGVDRKKGVLEAGMLNPEDVEAREALKFIAHRNNLSPKIYLITPTDFKDASKQYSTLRGEVEKALTELEKELEKEEIVLKKPMAREKIEKIAEEAPITRVVATILSHAIEERASDIHIEPMEKSLQVRFRVDGALHTSLLLPLKIHSAVVTRIKILSNLKIDETRVPQDGRFFTTVGNRKIDFRISTFPTFTGEKVVMRILDPSIGLRKLSELGLEGKNLKILKAAIQKPYGMILITGPTGSGKTTTLYSILNILNREDVNIISLEDPIEYFIEGVNQSQIRPEIGYTFSTGLRHVLRQDPDKIMVGEIRDNETAALAIHAALTGHLVLSTLHTNNALGVIPRLVDMGIDPYLIPPTLILAVAQRLVRKLCPESKELVTPSPKIQQIIDTEAKDLKEKGVKVSGLEGPHKIYRPKPSKACPKGTKGRIAIFEMLSMTSQLESIILKEPSEGKIKEEAERQKMTTMLQDGLLKALRGVVSFEEILKSVEETVERE